MPNSVVKADQKKPITFGHDVCGQIASTNLISTTSRVYPQLGKALCITFVEMF
jgi:hypothetical protein